MTTDKNIGVYLFDDQPDSWPAVQEAGMSCEAAMQPGPSGRMRYRAGSRIMAALGEFVWNEKVKEVTQPRFWYVVLASPDCSCSVTDTTYVVRFGQAGGGVLSYDERGLPALRLVMLLLYLVMAAGHMGAAYYMTDWRPMQLRWLTPPLLGEALAQLLLTIHWQLKASDGVGSPGAEIVARGVHEVGIILVWASLVATAGGAGVTRRHVLSTGDLKTLGGLLATLGVFVLDLVLVLWFLVDRDPSSTEYVFDSGLGVAVVVLQAFLGLWFLASLRWTWIASDVSDVRTWLLRLAGAGSLAFLLLPIVAIVAAAVPAYDRLTATEAASSSLYLVIMGLLVLLFQPILFAAPLEPLYRGDSILGLGVDEATFASSAEASLSLSALPSGDDAEALLAGGAYEPGEEQL